MKSLSHEENIIKDIKNLFRLKKELNYTVIKDIRILEKETEGIKDRTLRVLRIFLSMKKKKIVINQ